MRAEGWVSVRCACVTAGETNGSSEDTRSSGREEKRKEGEGRERQCN